MLSRVIKAIIRTYTKAMLKRALTCLNIVNDIFH